jgi:hypothetical protein
LGQKKNIFGEETVGDVTGQFGSKMTERWVSEDIVKDASGGYMNWTTLVDGKFQN